MSPFIAPDGFASVEAFEQALPSLEAQERRLQELRAVGALLMIERCFARHPLLAELRFSSDFEGWHISQPMVRLLDGELLWVNDILLAFYERDEPPSEPLPGLGTDDPFSALRQERLAILSRLPHPEMSAFSALSEEADAALAMFNRHAPSLFHQAIDTPERSARLEPGDAISLCHQLSLPSLAALIERARLAQSPGASRSDPISPDPARSTRL